MQVHYHGNSFMKDISIQGGKCHDMLVFTLIPRKIWRIYLQLSKTKTSMSGTFHNWSSPMSAAWEGSLKVQQSNWVSGSCG